MKKSVTRTAATSGAWRRRRASSRSMRNADSASAPGRIWIEERARFMSVQLAPRQTVILLGADDLASVAVGRSHSGGQGQRRRVVLLGQVRQHQVAQTRIVEAAHEFGGLHVRQVAERPADATLQRRLIRA